MCEHCDRDDDKLLARLHGLEPCIERGKVWDFLSHPSAIGVADPNFEVIDMIIDRVKRAGPRARLVSLDTVARAHGVAA